MDNLTHSLVGLAASKAGLEKLSPTTTAVCILAANAPDSDIVSLLVGGRWAFLHYHRGITHSLLGTFVLALVIPLIFYVCELLLARARGREPRIRLRGLILASLIVSATHPLLDWTNNYGIRLLLPWNSRWFYGDLVFIVDPFLWLVVGGAAFLLTSDSRKQIVFWSALALLVTYVVMFGPAGRAGLSNAALLRGFWVAALILILIMFKLKLSKRWGAKIGRVAFALVVLYWGGLAVLHSFALAESKVAAALISGERGESVVQVAAMPTLANPFHWQCVVETDRAAYRFEWFLFSHTRDLSNLVRYQRIETASHQAIGEAAKDQRVKIFLGFARFPVADVVDSDCTSQTLVQFADLRYTEPGARAGMFSLEVPVECSRH